MRTLAIDLGTRRIGLALSDEGGKFATPLDVLTVASADQAIDRVIQVNLHAFPLTQLPGAEK